ncbi:MAG: sigma-70 family RNA polymerase sigma factor [Acidobacteriota bacterium]
MSSQGEAGEVTRLLNELSEGKKEAEHRLAPLVHRALRQIAGALMKAERHEHSLQPTALVNEAWLRLVGSDAPDWENRRHFLAVAASVMRNVLVDHARERGAVKRGAGWRRVSLESSDADVASSATDVDVLALHQALERLERLHQRQARVIELRWFGGLSLEEAAEELGVSDWTVKNDWTIGRAWLRRELTREDPPLT